MSVPAFWTDLNLAVLLNQLSDGVVIIDRERRIRHFNEAAQAFNTKRMSFPTVIIAGFFGARFNEKPYFKAQAGAETAPKVKF